MNVNKGSSKHSYPFCANRRSGVESGASNAKNQVAWHKNSFAAIALFSVA